MLAMDWYGNRTLHETPLTNITVNGKAVAAVQNVGNFTFAYVVSFTSWRTWWWAD